MSNTKPKDMIPSGILVWKDTHKDLARTIDLVNQLPYRIRRHCNANKARKSGKQCLFLLNLDENTYPADPYANKQIMAEAKERQKYNSVKLGVTPIFQHGQPQNLRHEGRLLYHACVSMNLTPTLVYRKVTKKMKLAGNLPRKDITHVLALVIHFYPEDWITS